MGEVEHEQMEGAVVIEDNESVTERKMLKEEVREAEEKLRDLYASVPDPLSVYVGKEGHLIEYNKAFKKMFGYTDEELKNKTFLDFVHPDDRPLVLERYRTKYSEEELPLIYEIRGITKKGAAFPMEISVGQYKRKGRVIGINVMHRDITERKEMEKKLLEYSQHLEEMVEERTLALRKSEEMFRSIYNSSKDAIGFVSLDGILLDVNDSFPKLTGYSKDELLAEKNHQDMSPKKYHEYEAKIIESLLRTGKPAEYEKEYARKDGSLVPVLVTAFVVRGDNDKPIGFATIIKDISERNKAKD